jgi:hypothetical protein
MGTGAHSEPSPGSLTNPPASEIPSVNRSHPAARLLTSLLLGATIVACNTTAAPSPTPAPPTEAPSPSPAAIQLLLRITSEGGFIGPSANLAALPMVSVYADGRILTPGPIDAIYPGPLLAPVSIKDVGPAGVAAILAAIHEAGLDKAGAGGGIGNPDAATTVIAVTIDGTTTTSRFHFGGGPGGPGLPGLASPDPAVAAADAFVARLTDPAETWGVANPALSTFTPTAYRIFVALGAPAGDGTTEPPAIDWPLATTLDAFGAPAVPDRGIAGLRQGAVFGVDAATLAYVFASANQLTAFSSGGKPYTLFVRALLPDEAPAPG